jgi:biopolymer transport protein ExbD
MADISQKHESRNAPGKVRSKKVSTRIDMTPMVDLAFLLLTFFILTSTFNQSKMLKLEMPERAGDPPPMNDENILNVVLAENDTIYWWHGLEPVAMVTNYSKSGIRKIVLERRRTNPELMVLIKAQDNSRYQNMVDILDEMKITGTSRYAIVDLSEDDMLRIGDGRSH